MVTHRGYVDWEANLPRGWRRGSELFDAPSSAKNPSPSMENTTRTSLPGKLEATYSAARLMLSARTGTVKAPPSPLTSAEWFTKVSNGSPGAKMRWEKLRQAWRETGDRTSTRLRALLPGGRSRGARKRPLDSADHSRSPRRSHRGRESARRGHPHVFHPPLAAEREQGTLGCFQSSCNSPESIIASLARGSLSYSAVTPTLG
jgi:hypothetical protein